MVTSSQLGAAAGTHVERAPSQFMFVAQSLSALHAVLAPDGAGRTRVESVGAKP